MPGGVATLTQITVLWVRNARASVHPPPSAQDKRKEKSAVVCVVRKQKRIDPERLVNAEVIPTRAPRQVQVIVEAILRE